MMWVVIKLYLYKKNRRVCLFWFRKYVMFANISYLQFGNVTCLLEVGKLKNVMQDVTCRSIRKIAVKCFTYSTSRLHLSKIWLNEMLSDKFAKPFRLRLCLTHCLGHAGWRRCCPEGDSRVDCPPQRRGPSRGAASSPNGAHALEEGRKPTGPHEQPGHDICYCTGNAGKMLLYV